jgi:hypothetical protein
LTVLSNKVNTAAVFTAHIDTATETAKYKGTAAYDSARAFIGTVKTVVATDDAVDVAIAALP